MYSRVEHSLDQDCRDDRGSQDERLAGQYGPVRGRHHTLLDSYDLERRRVARQWLAVTHLVSGAKPPPAAFPLCCEASSELLASPGVHSHRITSNPAAAWSPSVLTAT